MTQLVIQAPKECEKLELLRAEIEAISGQALVQKIGTTETKDAALAIGAQVKRIRKALEDRRKQITDPMNDVIKQIIAYAKTLDAPLAKAEDHIRAQAVAYANAIAEDQRKKQAAIEAEKRRIREDEEKQLRAAEVFNERIEDELADKARIEQEAKDRRVGVAIVAQDVKAQGVKGTREEWTYEVTSPVDVPRQYWVLDHALLRNAVRVQKLREIPGVRIYSETKVSLARY